MRSSPLLVLVLLSTACCTYVPSPLLEPDTGPPIDADRDAFVFPDTGTFGCQSGADDCDDGDECTENTCDVPTGRCLYVPRC